MDLTFDLYNGVTIIVPTNWNDAKTFKPKFEDLMSNLDKGTRGVWCKVSIKSSQLIPVLVEEFSFTFHHTKPDYIMLTKWLPKNEMNVLPQYPITNVAVGGLVMNDQNQVLLVKELFMLPEYKRLWKFPGGSIDIGESITEAAQREVFEETSIKTEVVGILPDIRHTTNIDSLFQGSDMYFVVKLKPITNTIKIDPKEIYKCKWVDTKKVLATNYDGIFKRLKKMIAFSLENPNLLIKENKTHTNRSVYQIDKQNCQNSVNTNN
ncbi:hypothetical protein M0812_00820 [Anaeramoeba flamelloides]|uniref:Nudix hydrolase domain-containing protein n=1 Tax=Anaeramoeba flamelloides TaxID=1746091 RepID=A0AAV8A4J4_9EUKA|nr:hypothetical protein M0812_00820 [Anaeramoeba flamelloides]